MSAVEKALKALQTLSDYEQLINEAELLNACKRTYRTDPAESIAGIALRELGDESRWIEIHFLNKDRFPMVECSSDYYPSGSILSMPRRGDK